MNICLYGASSSAIEKSYMDAAFRLGELIAENGFGLVFGGGTNGLMGAAARGAHQKGGRIIGVAPGFFNADGVLFDKCTELVITGTMRERKQKMAELSDAFVMMPGGVGTFEEFFETFTAKQLGFHTKAIAVLNTNGYFDRLNDFLRYAVKEKFMIEGCFELYKVLSEPESVMDYLKDYVPNEKARYKF